ncbi:hypothetical protein Lokhon_02664 [Limimaricola hongkongensis DSM 17492]|uniref:Uncharacterized protein n=1 Tax=Limimaricola hongkongensis DSM 17492 TaxID=1122180 RepID=A0A017HB62_9RHOB|nr:hypothetical protein Lokhon_02664 [Limimaricola hongkongensis DSM 17492]
MILPQHVARRFTESTPRIGRGLNGLPGEGKGKMATTLKPLRKGRAAFNHGHG